MMNEFRLSEPSEAYFLQYVHTLGHVLQRLVWTVASIRV